MHHQSDKLKDIGKSNLVSRCIQISCSQHERSFTSYRLLEPRFDNIQCFKTVAEFLTQFERHGKHTKMPLIERAMMDKKVG